MCVVEAELYVVEAELQGVSYIILVWSTKKKNDKMIKIVLNCLL